MPRPIIPYNPHLKPLAKKLRQHLTFSEIKLWNALKNGKMLDYDFDRQRPIGDYIVDFYCKDLHLAIEVDAVSRDAYYYVTPGGYKVQYIKDPSGNVIELVEVPKDK